MTLLLLCGSFTRSRAKGNSCVHAHACSHSLPSDKRNKDAGEKSFQSPESNKEACGLQPQKAHVKELGTQHNKTAWIACVRPWVSPHKDLMIPHMQLPKNPHRLCVCTPNFISLCISPEGGVILSTGGSTYRKGLKKSLACLTLGEKGNPKQLVGAVYNATIGLHCYWVKVSTSGENTPENSGTDSRSA